MTSVAPAVTGMVKEAVVVVLDDSPPNNIVGAVRSCAWHVQPFGAVDPVAPFIVTTTVQEFAPNVIIPAEDPPVVEETEQPDVVNLVPASAMGVLRVKRVVDHAPTAVVLAENPNVLAAGLYNRVPLTVALVGANPAAV